MLVYCNYGFSKDIEVKRIYLGKLLSGLIYHFQNINFGEGVKEIVYGADCGDSVFLFSRDQGITYSRRSKIIGCGFLLGYEKILSLKDEDLCDYFIEEFINQTKRFSQFSIKKFDLNAFIESMNEYFAIAKKMVFEGKSPKEGKVLNQDIQSIIDRKFSKL